MKLTYWYIACSNDSDCFSIADKTKKGALLQLIDLNIDDYTIYGENYIELEKKELDYTDAFNLFDVISSGAGGIRSAGDTVKTYKYPVASLLPNKLCG